MQDVGRGSPVLTHSNAQCLMCQLVQGARRHCFSSLCSSLLLRLLQEYEARKAEDPEFYRAVDSLQYGGSGKVPEENIEKMVAELNDRWVQLLGRTGAAVLSGRRSQRC